MGDAKSNDSQLPDLPIWLWVILAPFIFLSIPFIAWGGFLLAAIAKAFGASEKTQQGAFVVAGVIVVPIFIMLLVSSALNSSSRSSRSYTPPGSSYYLGPKPARQPIGSDVAVRGHVRDGSYVSPHFRTRGNHTTSDNYSTYPNVNPYTGERGSRKGSSPAPSFSHSVARPVMSSQSTGSPAAPTTTAQPTLSSYDQRQRQQKVDALRRMGYEYSADQFTWSQLYDFEQRILKARSIGQLGVNLDWTKHTWSDLYDIEQRIRKSTQLSGLGYHCKWQDHTWSEMYDIEGRIRKSKELEQLGYRCDWRKYDYATLSDLCWEARKLNRNQR